MPNYLPQMPQFREAGGGWDWRQFADMVIPGNVWDSRSNEWRPRGIAAGAASTAFGPLAGALVEAMPDRMPQMPSFNGLGDWLSQRTGRDSRGGTDRANARVTAGTRGTTGAGSTRDWMRGDTDRANAALTEAVRNTRGAISTEDWLGGDSNSRARLGTGQLGRGGDEAIAYYTNAMMNNRALMER